MTVGLKNESLTRYVQLQNKLNMKLKTTLIFAFLSIIGPYSFSQNQEDIQPCLFLVSM